MAAPCASVMPLSSAISLLVFSFQDFSGSKLLALFCFGYGRDLHFSFGRSGRICMLHGHGLFSASSLPFPSVTRKVWFRVYTIVRYCGSCCSNLRGISLPSRFYHVRNTLGKIRSKVLKNRPSSYLPGFAPSCPTTGDSCSSSSSVLSLSLAFSNGGSGDASSGTSDP